MKNEDIVRKMSKTTFELLVMITRGSQFDLIGEQLEYYSNYNNTIIGTIVLDNTDRDFGCIVLCRDENSQFRAIETEVSIVTLEEARNWMSKKITEYTISETTLVVQGNSKKGVVLFDKITARTPHPYFLLLKDNPEKVAAKRTIIEIANHFGDIDGNYVKEFQSLSGFDARIWEIYLFAFFNEEKFDLNRNLSRPDFFIRKNGIDIGVEATIVARNSNNPVLLENFIPKTEEQIIKENANDMPIRYSSALTTKLNKKYWEIVPELKDKPFIIAIADYHEELSMTWSFASITSYLYGCMSSNKFGHLFSKTKLVFGL